MPDAMHLTPIGDATVLLEPSEALDPSTPDHYLVPLLDYLQKQRATRLLYDLHNVAVIDRVYYDWLTAIHALCHVANIKMIAVNMRPTAAYALALRLETPPPFRCALDVDSVRRLR